MGPVCVCAPCPICIIDKNTKQEIIRLAGQVCPLKLELFVWGLSIIEGNPVVLPQCSRGTNPTALPLVADSGGGAGPMPPPSA